MDLSTQRDAFNEAENADQKREAVFRAIKQNNGATLFHLVKLMGWPINRISGRVTELRRKGRIYNAGKRINPDSGKSGTLWRVK